VSILLAILGILVVAFVAMNVYLGMVLRWEDDRTVGLNYYGLPPEARQRFKRRLAWHARMLAPLLWVSTRLSKLDFRKARIQFKGISAPPGNCSMDSFAAAEAYEPGAEDIFVVTQMKCGTTWMLHVVYEVLMRGQGDLVETGVALHAVAPWIEGRKTVPMDQAPLVGSERPSRIIKTHLPVSLCPYGQQAKYIYVARHPASCFASCIDFVVTNTAGMEPPLAAFEEWFCSADLMWWGTWTDHVKGWWRRAQAERNVLFVLFENMKKDLPGIVRQVAFFLGVAPLSESEVEAIVRKCSFRYMQEHDEAFEMHPPHVLQSGASLFVSGSAERHLDVLPEARQRVVAWAARELRDSDFPLSTFYPDVASTSDTP
jgi:hypothetical protein